MKAILLAAGEGLGLRPLTDTIPKPLLEVLGKSVIERTINQLHKFGINDFIFITNYRENQIENFVKNKFPMLNVEFIHQPKIQGTSNALFLARNSIEEDFFICVNGDCIYSPSLVKRTVEAAKDELVSLGGKYTTDTEKYGILIVDKNKQIENIVEKPSKAQISEGYANIGIYSLNREIFRIIEKLEKNKQTSPRGEYEIPNAINELLEMKEFKTKLIELENEDYWFDIGRPWFLLDANEILLSHCKGEVRGEIEENVYIKGNVIIKKGAIIRSGTYIEGPVFIDEGADIGPNCYIRKNTYLGKKTRIGNGCEVKNSIIEDETHAAHLSYIGDSIIGPKCNLGAGTIIANLRLDKKTIPVVIKDKKEDSERRKLGAIIGEGVETGISVLVMPGIKIGSNSWIGAGTMVTEDIPPETIYYVTQTYTLKRKRKNAD